MKMLFPRHFRPSSKLISWVFIFSFGVGFLPCLASAEPITDIPVNLSETVITPVKRDSREKPPEPLVAPESSSVAPVTDPYSERALNNTFFLYKLQEDLKEANSHYRDNFSGTSAAQQKLTQTQDAISTLKEQIMIFDRQVRESETKILNITDQISAKDQDLNKLSEDINTRKIALAEQKKLLADYIRMQYVQEQVYFDDIGKMSPEKIFLSGEALSNTTEKIQSVSTFQNAGMQVLDELVTSTRVLEGLQLDLQNKKNRLDALRMRLQNEYDHLNDQKMAKAQLLQETRGDEQKYQELIAQSLLQQNESLLAISALQENMKYIQRKLRDFGADVPLSELQKVVDQRTKEFYDYQALQDDHHEFQWPVEPSRGISAYFHDPSYRARFGVDHNAIDIPTTQGSAVHAAKDGYVYKVKDNGMGYSYIILSHKDGYTTTYGHVSAMLVKEKDFVRAGDVIALSGGMPGTKGAGAMTTGAHLHFEILKDGKYNDPLDFLSLSRLPLESLPEKYSSRAESNKPATASEGFLPEDATSPLSDEDISNRVNQHMQKELQSGEDGDVNP